MHKMFVTTITLSQTWLVKMKKKKKKFHRAHSFSRTRRICIGRPPAQQVQQIGQISGVPCQVGTDKRNSTKPGPRISMTLQKHPRRMANVVTVAF